MLRIQFRNDHGDIRCAAMGAVVGYHRAFRLGISLFQRLDFCFGHVDGAKNKIHVFRHVLHLGSVPDNHILHGSRHGNIHGPTAAHRFLISFPCGTRTGGQHLHTKPRMVFEQGGKSLPYHACGAHNADVVRFHSLASFPNKGTPPRGCAHPYFLKRVIKKPVENRLSSTYNRKR